MNVVEVILGTADLVLETLFGKSAGFAGKLLGLGELIVEGGFGEVNVGFVGLLRFKRFCLEGSSQLCPQGFPVRLKVLLGPVNLVSYLLLRLFYLV